MESLHGAFLIFVTFPTSFAFQTYGSGIVWDANSQTYEEANTNKRENATNFLICPTIAYDFTKDNIIFS